MTWDRQLWPAACPLCGHATDPTGPWYRSEPDFSAPNDNPGYSPGFGSCWECGHRHPVLGRLSPEDFSPSPPNEPNARTRSDPKPLLIVDMVRRTSPATGLAYLRAFERQIRAQERRRLPLRPIQRETAAAERLKIWYHGTRQPAADAILEEGFAPGTYFGAHLEDAIWFGGGYVFEVAFPAHWKSEAGWQMTVPEQVPSSRIVALWRFDDEQLHDNAELRQEVFDSQPVEGT